MKMIRSLGWAALLLSLAATTPRAGGLRTPFGEVIVRNLKIGQTYSMYGLVNLPLRVVNTGDADEDLLIQTIRVSTTELRAGYEGIPSLDWVRVAQSTFTVAPNHEAATDLIISIPNDPAFLGRRFEADILSQTVTHRGMFAVALRSKLLMQIDSTPPTEEELKKKFVDEKLADLDFTVLPINAAIGDVPLGRELNLRKERKISIKLINPNDRPLNFRVRSIPVWESLLNAPDGFEAAPNPQWLKPQNDVIKVEGNAIADTSLTLSLPDDPQWLGRHFFFLVSFEVLEQKIPTRVYYRLMVDTARAQQKDAANSGSK